jgi:hypothetical protein
MALQLIYTSAPRLLQAGRTGFGTVAAHPGIPSWLVGEIERASQFSRVPGLDSARVVLRHMIFGQGDRVHHVLSRIQDAGADYTGRTNHIAHHFVFTAAEAVKATALGVTPVDALAFLESHKLWQASWDAEPRPLGDDEILPVESIPKTITLPAETYWGALVPGRPECAAILAPGKTSEACWIVYPQGWGNAIVYAMGESLALHSNPWGVSFANDLQPTDNEQQIAWRGIPTDSPLLHKAQSSVRPCIDLSNPNDLQFQPVPEYTEEARTGKKPLPKSLSAAPAAAKTRPDSKNLNAPPINRPAPATIPLLSKNNKQPRRNPYANPLVLILGILLLLLGVGGGGYHFYNSYAESTKKISGLKSEITAKIETLDTQKKGLLYENIDKAKNDLEKIYNPDHLNTLSDFLTEISNENVSKAKNSLDVMQSDHNYSSDWNNWRTVCDTLLRDKEKEIETETLHDLYAKACQGDALNDKEWDYFQELAKKIHPEDKKWGNALRALSFIRDTDLKRFEDWKQNSAMPQDRMELNNIVLIKINNEKIKIYNSEISKEIDKNTFIDKLKEHLKDWPVSDQKESLSKLLALLGFSNGDSSSEIGNLKKLGLEVPKFMESKSPENFESEKVLGGENSKAGESSKIYLTHDNETLKPKKPDKARNLIKKVSWNELLSKDVTNGDFWGEKQGSTQFAEEGFGFMVLSESEEPATEIPRYIVLNNEALDKSNNDFKLIVDVYLNKLIIKKDFSIFLNSLYTGKDSKIKQIFYSLEFKNLSFKKLNINKQKYIIEPFKAEIQLNNPNDLVLATNSDFDNQIQKLDENTNNLRKELNNKESEMADFRFKPTGLRPWEDFRKKIDETIKKLDEKNKGNLQDFKEIFNRDKSHKTVEGFLEEYSEVNNKDKFLISLSHLPEEQKSWFFFDDKKWSDDSRNKFKNQFGKDNLKKLEDKISDLKTDLNKQNNLKNNKEMEKNRELEKLKTDQKATLNFYLEEADTEPFLTTEVTIPFPFQPELPAVITTPPPAP